MKEATTKDRLGESREKRMQENDGNLKRNHERWRFFTSKKLFKNKLIERSIYENTRLAFEK